MRLLPEGKAGWARMVMRVLGLFIVLGVALGGLLYFVTSGPGRSHRGPLPALTAQQAATAARHRAEVEHLSLTIGARDLLETGPQLARAEAWVIAQLEAAGLRTERQPFTVSGVEVANVVATLPGASDEVVVFGAHYDTVPSTPGADDNASGVTVMLELARRAAKGPKPKRTVKFVAFVNEEPPWFKTEEMGSLVFARAEAAAGRAVTAMVSLEMLGTYSDAPGSQQYPPGVGLLYPTAGNFVAFVGDLKARPLVRRSLAMFRANAAFPSEMIAAPAFVQGVDFSDHWSFWQAGYGQALMVTDTAFNRTPHYHEPTDTPDRLDFERMARVTDGLEFVLADLANGP